MPFRQANAMPLPSRILITGASGELGSALARRYARPGLTLLLWGRNGERLDRVAEACRASGADAQIRSVDLVDSDAVHAALAAEDEFGHGIDMAFLVAGLSDTVATGNIVENPAQILRTAQVNFAAPSAMAADLARRMAARRRGHIVLIGSAASDHALPFAAAYAASKAGLARFAHALRIAAAQYGVRVTLISPGFIDTAAARRTPGPKPFMLAPAAAADRIAEAVNRGRAELVFPWPFLLLRIVSLLLPRFLRDRLLLRLTPPSA